VSPSAPVNCPRCGRLSPCLVRGECPACLREEHRQLAELRAYLREHQARTAQEISEQTGIPLERVLRWIREGRLIPMAGVVYATCRRCGRGILIGVLCPVCRQELAAAVRELQRALARQEKPAPAEEQPRRRIRRRPEPPARFDLR
jgi:hypothetical protein